MWTFGHLEVGEAFYVETYGEHNNYMAPMVGAVKVAHTDANSGPANCKLFGSEGVVHYWLCPDHAEVKPGPVPIDKIFP